MPGNITVSIKRAEYYAFHGLYPGERKTGNRFELNLDVTYDPGDENNIDIRHTIDYQTLHAIVREEMQEPVNLMETVCTRIAAHIRRVFPQTRKIRLSLAKLHPPIEQFSGQVEVSFEKEY